MPHTFGAAWTYRDGSSGANKKWPINFGVRFVNAERIAEAAILSAFFVHAHSGFFTRKDQTSGRLNSVFLGTRRGQLARPDGLNASKTAKPATEVNSWMRLPLFDTSLKV